MHAYGPVRVVHDRAEQLTQVRELSEHYEPRSQPEPRFDVDALPAKVRDAELKGIVAFEMTVSRMDAAFKLSQNRNDGDHARIISELEARGDDPSAEVARAMKDRR